MIQSKNIADNAIDFHLVIPSLMSFNQKQMFVIVSSQLSKMMGMSERIVLDRLMDKEKFFPSSIGNGCAIMSLQVGSLTESLNVFVRLKRPISMKGADDTGVDLFCLLLTPEREGSSYLRSVSRLSRFLKNGDIAQKLRSADNEKLLKNILSPDTQKKLAA